MNPPISDHNRKQFQWLSEIFRNASMTGDDQDLAELDQWLFKITCPDPSSPILKVTLDLAWKEDFLLIHERTPP